MNSATLDESLRCLKTMRMMSLGLRINQPHSITPWHSRVSIFPMRVYGREWTQDSEGSLHGGAPGRDCGLGNKWGGSRKGPWESKMGCVLVGLSCSNKTLETRWLKPQTSISRSSGDWEVQNRDAGRFGFFLAYRRLPALCVFTMQRKSPSFPFSSCKDTNPVMGAPPS